MSAIPIAEEPEIVKARVGDAALPTEKEIGLQEHRSPDSEDSVIDADTPSEEDLKTLRRVSGPIPWTALSVGFVEACERFSYYGTTAVCTIDT